MQKHLQKLNPALWRGKLDKLIRYGIAAILIAVPLYPKFPFLQVPGIYVSIRIEDFLILIVTVLWLIKNSSNLLQLWKNSIVRAIVLFLATALLATASGIFFLHTATPIVGILEWGRRVEYLMGFFIAITSIKSQKDIEFYVKCVGIVLIVVFVYGFGQKYFAWPVITTQNSEYSKGIALRYVAGGHLSSSFSGNYDLATYIILTSPIFISILFMKKESLKRFLDIDERVARGLVFFILAISFWLMVNAASRISAASYMMALSITLILIRKYKYILVVGIVTVIFAFTTSSLFNRYLNILDLIRKRMSFAPAAYAQSVVSPLPVSTPQPPPAPAFEDRSTSIRVNVEWPRSIRAFEKNPLLGTGYGSTTLATDNDYLRALGEIGILGVISMFFVFFRIIKELIQKSWPKGILSKKEIDFRTVYLAGIIGAIPGILLNAVFLDMFEASKFAITFWFLIGFAVILTIHEKNY